MRISDLSADTIRLYRGDASYVSHFEIGKTDQHALFGHGIYLTDSAEVAGDYTLKAASEDVVFGDGSRNQGSYSSKEALVRSYLGKLAEDLGFKQAHEELRKKWSSVASDKQREVYANAPSDRYPTREELTAAIAGIEDAYKIERRKLAQKFVMQAKKVYAGQDIRIMHKTTGEWVMVKSGRGGIISAFDVPVSYCNKTIDAEAPMPESILPIIKAAFYAKAEKPDGPLDLRSWGPDGKGQNGLTFDQYIDSFKKYGTFYAWADRNIGGKGLNPSLDEILNGTHQGFYVWEKGQDILVRKLQALGYVGFRYQGGVRLGGTGSRGGGGVLHRAYSFWDEKTINGFRIDNHPRPADDEAPPAKGLRTKGILGF